MIRPTEDRVVVAPFDPEERTPGGLVLPDVAREKPQQGEVLAVGPGRILSSGQRAPLAVKPGDVVLYSRYAGAELEVDGERVRVMVESEILCVVEASAA